MKKIYALLTLLALLTQISSLFCNTYLYFTNRTPFTLKVTEVQYAGGEHLASKYWEKLADEIKPGEGGKKIFKINRDDGIEDDKIYGLRIGLEVPTATVSGKTQPPFTLWCYVKVKGTWDASDIWYSAKMEQKEHVVFDDAWHTDTEGELVNLFTRTAKSHYKAKNPESFELSYKEVPAANHLKTESQFDDLEYELVWYLFDWQFEYPDVTGTHETIFDKIAAITSGIPKSIDSIKAAILKWEDIVKNIKDRYIPAFDKDKTIGAKIQTIDDIIPELIGGINKIQEVLYAISYNLIEPFDQKVFEKIKEVIDGVTSVIEIIQTFNTLVPEVVGLVNALQSEFNTKAQKHIKTLQARNYIETGTFGVLTNKTKTNYKLLDSAGTAIYNLPAGSTKLAWKDLKIGGKYPLYNKLYNKDYNVIFKADNGEDVIVHGDKTTKIITVSKKVKYSSDKLETKTFITLDMNKLANHYVHPDPKNQELNWWAMDLGIEENNLYISMMPVYIDRITGNKYYQDYIAITEHSAYGRQNWKKTTAKDNKTIDSQGLCGYDIVKQQTCK